MNANHGDERHLTLERLMAAAQAANSDVPTVARRLIEGVSQLQQAHEGEQATTERWDASWGKRPDTPEGAPGQAATHQRWDGNWGKWSDNQ
jgi:hypothetical protein